jgi:hypothetical protein
MKKLLIIALLLNGFMTFAQSPVITSWLQNRTGIKGRHYVAGNSTPIQDNDSANVQQVFYSTNWAYIRTKGIPAYISGPFLDGNPSVATSQNAIFKFPLNPQQNPGTPTSTTGGNIGVFINGVALFDYRDGVSWKNSTNALCGGPVQPPCMGDGLWNRDAVVGERLGFDCSKAHPAMGNYHHHQNPSAFGLDLNVISTVCNLYASDGLYAIDSTIHSPLLGFAYDGFPIYGAYAYKNINGTGGIVRMKSSYTLRNITTRTTNPAGVGVLAGPPVSTTYPLGYFREDYQYNTTSATTPDYLDDHNGRFCVTPEYPSGIYCYFTTVNANWNSAYPYVVGPTFYGTRTVTKPAAITEPVTQYISGPTVSPTVTNLLCGAATLSTQPSVNVAYTGTATIGYTGGNGVAYSSGASISSTSVTGLTATLQPGSLTSGNGSISFNITGTATSTGTANFAISFGGQSCTLSVTVNNTVPVNPTVTALNCTSATTTAGTVNTAYSGNVTVPYTGGNGVAYTTGTAIQSTTVTGLTATLQPGNLANGNGNLTYSISGTPTSVGTASFTISFGGKSCTLNITINDGMPLMPEIQTLDCANAIISPQAFINTAFTGTATIAYTGGNGAAYPFAGPIVASTGVTGLSASIQPGTLTTGNGNLVLAITGTPTATGTASFAIDFGRVACVFNVNVVSVGNAVPFDYKIRPNPIINNNLHIELNATNQEASNIWIYDETGRKLISKSTSDLTGSIIDINVGPLSNGTYIIKVMDKLSQVIITKRFLKR